MLVDENIAPTASTTTAPEKSSDAQSKPRHVSNNDTSLLSKITHHPTLRRATFALSTLIGGAGVTTMTGCHEPRVTYPQKVTAVRSLEKEAKFSTLAQDAKVPLQEMPKLLEQREALANAVNRVIPHAREVVTSYEAEAVTSQTALDGLMHALEGVKKAATVSAEQESFAAIRGKLTELSAKAQDVQKLTVIDFPKEPLNSTGYLQTQSLMQALYDWSTALDRDIVNLKRGTHALKIANLSTALSKAEAVVEPLTKEASIKDWAARQPQESTKAKEGIATTLGTLEKTIPDPAFAPIDNLLAFLKSKLTSLSEALTVKSGESAAQPSGTASQNAPTTDAAANPQRSPEDIAREALATIIAIRLDMNRELTNTLGAQIPPEAPQPQVASGGNTSPVAQQQRPQEVHHHHNSGMSPLLWYMLLNNNSTGAGYTYVPNHTPTYSGSNRFYSSREYERLDGEVQRNDAKLRPTGGFGSRAPQSNRNTAPTSRPSRARAPARQPAPAAPSHSSGFSTRRFSSGFGS